MFFKKVIGIESLEIHIEKLTFFSNIPYIPPLIARLRKIGSNTPDNEINGMRKVFNTILNTWSGNVALADACYNILLALAKYEPINDTCVITQEPIDKINAIYTSTGYQFDVNQIKILFPNILREETCLTRRMELNRDISNPYTRTVFSTRDKIHILAVASRSRIAEDEWIKQLSDELEASTRDSIKKNNSSKKINSVGHALSCILLFGYLMYSKLDQGKLVLENPLNADFWKITETAFVYAIAPAMLFLLIIEIKNRFKLMDAEVHHFSLDGQQSIELDEKFLLELSKGNSSSVRNIM
jgi:hypothetical protein